MPWIDSTFSTRVAHKTGTTFQLFSDLIRKYLNTIITMFMTSQVVFLLGNVDMRYQKHLMSTFTP